MLNRLDESDRPLPIFIHSFCGNALHWDEVRAVLGPGMDGMAVELPGHGEQRAANPPFTVERAARDVAALLPARGTVLIGHSMGSRVAINIAAMVPEQIKALVLVDGSNQPLDGRDVERTLATDLATMGHERVIRGIVESFLIDGIAPSRREDLITTAMRMPLEALTGYWSDMAAWDRLHFTNLLPRVSCPVMVLQSTRIFGDPFAKRERIADEPSSRWLEWLRLLERVEVHIVRGCGHYTMIERPECVAVVLQRIDRRI